MTLHHIEALMFLLGSLGALSQLNELGPDTSLRRRISYSLVAGGCFGAALEPFFQGIEGRAHFFLAAGIALAAWPRMWRDLRAAMRRPSPARLDRLKSDT